jgi:hypothetical protein
MSEAQALTEAYPTEGEYRRMLTQHGWDGWTLERRVRELMQRDQQNAAMLAAARTAGVPIITVGCICCGMDFLAPEDGNRRSDPGETDVWFGCDGCGCEWPEPPGMTAEARAQVHAQVAAASEQYRVERALHNWGNGVGWTQSRRYTPSRRRSAYGCGSV